MRTTMRYARRFSDDESRALLDSFYRTYEDMGFPIDELMVSRRAYYDAVKGRTDSVADTIGRTFQ